MYKRRGEIPHSAWARLNTHFYNHVRFEQQFNSIKIRKRFDDDTTEKQAKNLYIISLISLEVDPCSLNSEFNVPENKLGWRKRRHATKSYSLSQARNFDARQNVVNKCI